MKRCLIVDDLEQNCYMLESLFKGNGFITDIASNGAEALNRARELKPDVIISDILMPVMDGFTLCRECKKDKNLRCIPFIFYTATYIEPKDEAFALSLGADRFLVKPQEPEVLIKEINDVLNKKASKEDCTETANIKESEFDFILGHYDAIIRKLEDKMNELQKLNERLAREIEERKKAQVELERERQMIHEAEEKYRFLTEKMSDIVWTADVDLVIKYISPSVTKILGITPEQRIGQKFSKQVTPDTYEKMMNLYLQELELERKGIGDPERTLTVEMEYFHKSGKTVWMESVLKGIRDETGKLIAIHGVSRDITERKDSEHEKGLLVEQLMQAQKIESIGRLAGGVAHDFNNMLMPIMGYAEMMSDEIPENHPHRQPIDVILKTTGRARDLTRQLLAFARKQKLEIKPVDINNVIISFEKMLRRTIREDVLIELNLADVPMTILADVGQIEQVLMNLAVNAQDSMDTGGILHIKTSEIILDECIHEIHNDIPPGSYVLLSVSDTGCGIDHDIMDKIFEPFFTTKEAGKGTGLGLSTVFGIVKQHNGGISLYSEKGFGTTFNIYFPRIDELPLTDSVQDNTGIIYGGSETILVVEDEDSIRMLISEILKRNGYNVIVSPKAIQTVDFFRSLEKKPELLLTDVIMSGINGPELNALLNALCPELKVLYMSGYPGDVITRRGIAENDNFIQKPFSTKTLLKMIRKVLNGNS